MRLCVLGMGMILWGVSPLYIIQKDILYDNLKKYYDLAGLNRYLFIVFNWPLRHRQHQASYLVQNDNPASTSLYS